MEQSKAFLLPSLPLLPVSIVAKFLQVSQKLCSLAYLNKAWHKFIYSGYAWEELNIERGKRGWRDDIRFFINKFLAKFSQHTLVRRLDFSSLTLPSLLEQEFCSWLVRFGFVDDLHLYGEMKILIVTLNEVFQEETTPYFMHLHSLRLDLQASKQLLDASCNFFCHTPALERLSINFLHPSKGIYDMTGSNYSTQLQRIKELKQLSITGNFSPAHKNIMSFFEALPQSCPKLTQISLQGSQFNVLLDLLRTQLPYWEMHLTSLTYIPPLYYYQQEEYLLFKFIALQKLTLKKCPISPQEISNLVSRCKSLQLLHLEDVITGELGILKHQALRQISLINSNKIFGLKLGDLPCVAQITLEYNLAKFQIQSEIPLKLTSLELEVESKESEDPILKLNSLELAQSSLKVLEISFCQIKKSSSALDKLAFAFMASASLSTVAILSSLSCLERLHSLAFHPRIYNPDEMVLIHSLFPQLVKLHLSLNRLENTKGLIVSLKHPYLRRLKIQGTSPVKEVKGNYEVLLKLGQDCQKLETVQIEGIIQANLELKTNLKKLKLGSPITNMKISTEVGIQSVVQTKMSQVFDFPLMQRLLLNRPNSFQMVPFSQRFRSLRFLWIDALVKFNQKELSELLRNAVNLETLKIRFYPEKQKDQKFIINHAKLRNLTLRDGHKSFQEIIIGAKCEQLEELEICWFLGVVLTLQGGKKARLLLVQTELIDKQ